MRRSNLLEIVIISSFTKWPWPGENEDQIRFLYLPSNHTEIITSLAKALYEDNKYKSMHHQRYYYFYAITWRGDSEKTRDHQCQLPPHQCLGKISSCLIISI